MVGGGYLTLDVAGYGGLSIAKKGRALIEGDGSFRYRADMIRAARPTEKKAAPVMRHEELEMSTFFRRLLRPT